MSSYGIDIERVRREIPATQRVIYMNTGWSGPSPRCVVEAVKARLEFESFEGPTSRPVLESRMQLGKDTREAIASLLHVTAPEITLTQNTTEGINIVLNGFEWTPGDEVITCNLEHPSILVPCLYLARRRGVTLKIVELDGLADAASVLRRFEEAITPRTKLIAISHIAYCNGLRLPLREINEVAHSHGATVLVDGAQTAGHIPLDLPAMACDYYSIPGHKWLLGPDGVGALYIRQDLIPSVQPAKVGGAAAKRYDRDGTLEPEMEAIRKFELTTTSGPLWAGMVEAIRYLQALGLEQTEARLMGLAGSLVCELREIPKVTVLSPGTAEMASGLVTFAIQGVSGRDASAQLWERGSVVARPVAFPEGVRLSIDFFNTEEEIARVLDVVRDLAVHGYAPAEGRGIDIDKDL